MEIKIGENIKRLRTEKGVTQEQLAEATCVSAVAVSKWERGETMPDLTMLPRLAYYFQVTIDELMSYDACAVDLEIRDFIELHTKEATARHFKTCRQLSANAYKKYPNDYRVMELYMWDLVGGYADNDAALLRKHSAELERICDRIINGCKDRFIVSDAIVMRGKLLYASGRADEALRLYQKELPDWYQTVGQKSEQLFDKQSPEFAQWLSMNMLELAKFVLNKKSKELWFCTPGTLSEKTKAAVALCEAMSGFSEISSKEDLRELISYFAGDFEAKLLSVKAEKALLDQIRAYM
ncbi:MAG: helix-turn-helix transcriptional regulator [Lachnospiraceae bacterium]|nr:helix-turn-helix transcriptional regulator [Lachnospiraceae bacterium]